MGGVAEGVANGLAARRLVPKLPFLSLPTTICRRIM